MIHFGKYYHIQGDSETQQSKKKTVYNKKYIDQSTSAVKNNALLKGARLMLIIIKCLWSEHSTLLDLKQQINRKLTCTKFKYYISETKIAN